MDQEHWRPIPEWPGYEISDLGRLRSWRPMPGSQKLPSHPRILAGGHDKDGYRRAVLTRPGSRKSFRVAHLVALLWMCPKPAGKVLAHHNGVNTDDRVSNLRWKTQRENILDKLRHGTMPIGEVHCRARLNRRQVHEIRESQEYPKAIASRFGVSVSTVDGIRARRTWKWLKDRVK